MIRLRFLVNCNYLSLYLFNCKSIYLISSFLENGSYKEFFIFLHGLYWYELGVQCVTIVMFGNLLVFWKIQILWENLIFFRKLANSRRRRDFPRPPGAWHLRRHLWVPSAPPLGCLRCPFGQPPPLAAVQEKNILKIF